MDEQNAQTQQQVFSLRRAEEDEGLVEEEEEDEVEEDKMSLQSSYSTKQRHARRGHYRWYRPIRIHVESVAVVLMY